MTPLPLTSLEAARTEGRTCTHPNPYKMGSAEWIAFELGRDERNG